MSNWISYANGNYNVRINSQNGTKIRETEDDEFISEFPENIDIKITNKCLGRPNSNGVLETCNFCHENSTPEGLNGELNVSFINTLRSGSELAIGGGSVFEHPGLENFLHVLKAKQIFSNVTVNQHHYEQYIDTLKLWAKQKLIYGIGVSAISNSMPFLNDNVVIHVINGIHKLDDILALAKQGHKKLLILGYKNIRRGKTFLEQNFDEITNNSLYDHLYKIVEAFPVVSFDNLALEQLNVRRLFTTKQWEEFYMGDDGQFTMYIDLVKRQFAKNSTSLVRYDLLDNIDDMFRIVKAEKV